MTKFINCLQLFPFRRYLYRYHHIYVNITLKNITQITKNNSYLCERRKRTYPLFVEGGGELYIT